MLAGAESVGQWRDAFVTYDVPILAPDGSVLTLPERWATLVAEETLRMPSVSKETAVSAARKIESRLTGEDQTPVAFDDDERVEFMEKLEVVCGGWHKSEGGAWKDSAAYAFCHAFLGES